MEEIEDRTHQHVTPLYTQTWLCYDIHCRLKGGTTRQHSRFEQANIISYLRRRRRRRRRRRKRGGRKRLAHRCRLRPPPSYTPRRATYPPLNPFLLPFDGRHTSPSRPPTAAVDVGVERSVSTPCACACLNGGTETALFPQQHEGLL